MIKKWTANQQKAIFATGGTILVTAAAGSGKTSVLVQRVINLITNKDSPVDIDKLLIVTFTNSAAQEMKERISESLSELVRKAPNDLNLQRQQMLLKRSFIGTIHSFCISVLRENFFKVGISPKFRVARGSEALVLKQKAMESTLEHFYNEADKEFLSLVNFFSNEKNFEKFNNVIELIYNFTESIPFPERWFKEVLDLYKPCENSLKITPWQKIIIDYSTEALETAIKLMNECLDTIVDSEEFKKAYFSSFEKDILELKKIKTELNEKNWNKIQNKILSFSFSRLNSAKLKDFQEEKNLIISKRDYIKNIILDIKKYFSFNQEEINESSKLMYSKVKTLFEVTNYFTEEFKMLKFSKDLVDFSDLEHLTLNLLIEENEEKEFKKSKIADDISKCYKEVMIDEYQDINEVQGMIFKFITADEKNMFMVGDVKQSIYKFRQSRPEIFLQKKNAYPIYNEKDPKYPSKIILGENFRSSSFIIDSINFIFKCLMSKNVGEIDYSDEEKLVCGSDYLQEDKSSDFSIKLIESSNAEDKEEEERLEAREAAKIILKTISEKYKVLKNGEISQVTFSDFCILLRSSNAHAHIYAQELEVVGIPSHSEASNSFLNTMEITSMLSLLKVINNPINDIALVSIMLSPLFGFSPDDLSRIRQIKRKVPFYFALKEYSEAESSRVNDFINKIDYYRKISTTLSCEELIDYIYQDTNYPTLCSALPKGKLKKANLLLLKDYAKKFEQDSGKNLSGFLDFIENIQSKKSDLPSACLSADSENTVRIMSIHKSKGLEFPIVILAGCSRKFVQDNESIIIHPKLGVGMKLKNSENTFQYDNIIRQSISLVNKFENISEEVRVFYVALTRARQKIYVISSVKNVSKLKEKILAFSSQSSVSPYKVKNADSFLEWIILCILNSSERKKLFEALNIKHPDLDYKNLKSLNWSIELITQNVEKIKDLNSPSFLSEGENSLLDENLLKKIKGRVEFKYPFESFSKIPIRISASELSHGEEWKNRIAATYPAFISNLNVSPTTKGTAMHEFMCRADLKNVALNLDSELERLNKKGFFSNDKIKLLNRNSILNFTNSNVCRRILNSSEVLKEHRFSVKMSLRDVPSVGNNLIDENLKDNFIIVQGAIDCIFKEEDGYAIIDYKTDKASSLIELYDKYRLQLEIYKYAFENSKKLKVKEMIIYSFYLSDYYSFS